MMIRRWQRRAAVGATLLPQRQERSDFVVNSWRLASTRGTEGGKAVPSDVPAAQADRKGAHNIDRGAPPSMPEHLAVFHSILQSDKAALNFHRELTMMLATGDAESASECAAVLANRVKKHLVERQRATSAAAPEGSDAGQRPSGNVTRAAAHAERLPPPPNDMLDVVTDKLVEGALAEESRIAAAKGDATPIEATIIDTSFETDANEDEDDEAAQAQEATAMQVLDEYLDTEGERWRLQRHAIAKVILEAASAVGVHAGHVAMANQMLAEDVQERRLRSAGRGWGDSDEEAVAATAAVTPFDMTNIVIRGNAPTAAHLSQKRRQSIDSQVEQLREKALKAAREAGDSEEGAWNARIEQIVRFELQLHESTMKYDVGIHESLSEAIDRVGLAQPRHSAEELAAVKRKEKAKRVTSSGSGGATPQLSAAPSKIETSPSRIFVTEVVRRLNEPSQRLMLSREAAATAKPSESHSGAHGLSSVDESLASPVLPFDFVMRLSLREQQNPLS